MASSMSQYEERVWDFFSDIPLKSDISQCIFCKNKTKSALKFKKYYLNIHQCECGFVYLKNQPTNDQLKSFYENSKALEAWAEIKTTDQELERQRLKFSRAIDLISKDAKPQVLDLGCGNGVFLKLLREKAPNSVCVGVDTNIPAAKVAENSNSIIVREDVEKFLANTNMSFDYITLWGILEHVKDPERLVQLLKKKLTGEKTVIVCVPNINSLVCLLLQEKCFTFCPQHLWYYSINTLKRLFKDFKLQEYWTIEPEEKPIRRFTENQDPYNKDVIPETKTQITTLKKSYESLSDYILEENLGYKVVAVFKL